MLNCLIFSCGPDALLTMAYRGSSFLVLPYTAASLASLLASWVIKHLQIQMWCGQASTTVLGKCHWINAEGTLPFLRPMEQASCFKVALGQGPACYHCTVFTANSRRNIECSAKEAVPGKINEVGHFSHPWWSPTFVGFAPYCLKSSETLEPSPSGCHFVMSLCRWTPFAAGSWECFDLCSGEDLLLY